MKKHSKKRFTTNFRDSSGKTMTEVATPSTEATPAATTTDAAQRRRQSHPVQGGGRCRSQEGHNGPHSTSKDNHVNTKITTAAGAKKLPKRPKSGKPAGTGRPAPTTYVVKPKKTTPSGTRPTSKKTAKGKPQKRAIPMDPIKIVISDSWRTVLNKSQDHAVHNQGGSRRTRRGRKKKARSTKQPTPNNGPSPNTGKNNYVKTSTITVGAEETQPQFRAGNLTETNRPIPPADEPPRGRPQSRAVAGTTGGRPTRRSAAWKYAAQVIASQESPQTRFPNPEKEGVIITRRNPSPSTNHGGSSRTKSNPT